MYVFMYARRYIYIIYICVCQFPRSTPLGWLAEQPAVAPPFHATATWESATDLNKTSLDLHKSDRKPRLPGGATGICQQSHLQSDRTHQMRKLPAPKLKSPRSDRPAGATEQLDQLGFGLPKSLGARIRDSRLGKRSRFGLSSWMIARIGRNISDRRSRLRPGTRRHQHRRSLRLRSRTGRLRIRSHHNRSTN